VLAFLTSLNYWIHTGNCTILLGEPISFLSTYVFKEWHKNVRHLSDTVYRWKFGLTTVPLTACHTPTGNINIYPSAGYLNFRVVYGKLCEHKTKKLRNNAHFEENKNLDYAVYLKNQVNIRVVQVYEINFQSWLTRSPI